MHPNPVFRKTERQDAIEFAHARSFGILSVNSDPSPLISHIPFQLSEDGTYLEAHLVRSNPILRVLDAPSQAVLAVSGPDAYVSPDWYGVEQQVPTWNYIAVHLRGSLRRLEQGTLPGILERLSSAMEARLLPKPAWTMGKLTDDTYAKLSRQIVPVAMTIEQIDSTWKLSQNKHADAVAGAALGIKESEIGSEVAALAALMKGI